MPRAHLPGTAFLPPVRDMGMAPASDGQHIQAGRQIGGMHTLNTEQPIVPSIQALRTTAVDRALVQQRLQELN